MDFEKKFFFSLPEFVLFLLCFSSCFVVKICQWIGSVDQSCIIMMIHKNNTWCGRWRSNKMSVFLLAAEHKRVRIEEKCERKKKKKNNSSSSTHSNTTRIGTSLEYLSVFLLFFFFCFQMRRFSRLTDTDDLKL